MHRIIRSQSVYFNAEVAMHLSSGLVLLTKPEYVATLSNRGGRLYWIRFISPSLDATAGHDRIILWTERFLESDPDRFFPEEADQEEGFKPRLIK